MFTQVLPLAHRRTNYHDRVPLIFPWLQAGEWLCIRAHSTKPHAAVGQPENCYNKRCSSILSLVIIRASIRFKTRNYDVSGHRCRGGGGVVNHLFQNSRKLPNFFQNSLKETRVIGCTNIGLHLK